MVQSVLALFFAGLMVCSAKPKTTVESNEIIVAAESSRCRPGRCFRAALVNVNPALVPVPPVPPVPPGLPIPALSIGDGGVSASFGGYHASAGLGGSLNGGPAGGLHAEAGIPGGTGAGAGLGGKVGSGGGLYSQAGVGGGPGAGAAIGGGSSASSSAGSSAESGRPNHPQRPSKQRPADFYDNIFNIPISVLQAVNQLLGGAPPNKHGSAGASSSTGASAGAHAGAGIQTRSGSVDSAGSSTFAQAGGSVGGEAGKGGFFDQIFNIPISALRSVNQFLNAKNQQG